MFASLVRRKPAQQSKSAKDHPTPVAPDSLSDLQLILLSKAAQAPDGCLRSTDVSANDEACRALATLQAGGLLAATDDAEAPDRPAPNRRIPIYKITPAGLGAMCLDEAENGATESIGASIESSAASAGIAADDGDGSTGGTGTEPYSDITSAEGLLDATEAPTKPASINGRVLALPRRTEGVSMAELTDAIGWQPHSLRAVVSRLRSKGHPIERSRRPADGAGTYRLAEQASREASDVAVIPAEG